MYEKINDGSVNGYSNPNGCTYSNNCANCCQKTIEAKKEATTKKTKTATAAAKQQTAAAPATNTPAKLMAKPAKSYSKPAPSTAAAGNDKVIGKDDKGRTIYEGKRGGHYYINSNGNKTYIKKKLI